MSLVSEYEQVEYLSEDALESNIPNVIFDLPPYSYALITFDLRHLLEESYSWTYGEDWSISFTVKDNLTVYDPASPIPMPE